MPDEIESLAAPDNARAHLNEAPTAAIEMTLEERRAAQVGDRQLPFGLSRAIIAPTMKRATQVPQLTCKQQLAIASLAMTNERDKKEKRR